MSAVGETLAIVDVVVSIRTVKSLKGKRNTKLNLISKLIITSLFNTKSFLFHNIFISNQTHDCTRTFRKNRLNHLSERNMQFVLALLNGFGEKELKIYLFNLSQLILFNSLLFPLSHIYNADSYISSKMGWWFWRGRV